MEFLAGFGRRVPGLSVGFGRRFSVTALRWLLKTSPGAFGWCMRLGEGGVGEGTKQRGSLLEGGGGGGVQGAEGSVRYSPRLLKAPEASLGLVPKVPTPQEPPPL